jgi:hypothetical protein
MFIYLHIICQAKIQSGPMSAGSIYTHAFELQHTEII